MKSLDDIKDYNFVNVVDFTIAKRLTSCCNSKDIKTIAFQELEDEEIKTVDIDWLGDKQHFRIDK